jgi:hypothetical protein
MKREEANAMNSKGAGCNAQLPCREGVIGYIYARRRLWPIVALTFEIFPFFKLFAAKP